MSSRSPDPNRRSGGTRTPAWKPSTFDRLHADVRAFLDTRELFVQDLFGGADPAYRLPVRFITPSAWHALFVRHMFIRAQPAELARFQPGFTVLHAPEFHADPGRHGTRSGTFVVINFAQRIVLIGGTHYAGEMKKSVFTVLNYLLPHRACSRCTARPTSAPDGDTAIFFGLSGTGKTTLSADPARSLIGDDEHGWSDSGVFNFEGGCYAKGIRLRPRPSRRSTTPPDVRHRARERGAGPGDARGRTTTTTSITENTRACYPMDYIPQSSPRRRRRPSEEHRLPHRRRVRRACRRSRGSRPSRRCTTSSPATRRRWPAPRRA